MELGEFPRPHAPTRNSHGQCSQLEPLTCRAITGISFLLVGWSSRNAVVSVQNSVQLTPILTEILRNVLQLPKRFPRQFLQLHRHDSWSSSSISGPFITSTVGTALLHNVRIHRYGTTLQNIVDNLKTNFSSLAWHEMNWSFQRTQDESRSVRAQVRVPLMVHRPVWMHWQRVRP